MESGNQNELEKFYRQNIGKYIIQNDRSQQEDVLENDIKIISPDNFMEIETSVGLLDEFSFYNKKKKEIDMNHADIYNFKEESEKRLKEMPPQERDKYSETLYIDANRKLTNYLSSLITFINDFIEKRVIKKRYGEDSHEFKYFKNRTAYWYDHKFSYRFFYHLRNYAIHYRFPLQNAYYSLDLNKDEKVPISFSIELNFDKKKLFQNNTFRKKMEDDLATYNGEFPLLPLLREISSIHIDILKVLLEITGDKYISPARYILDLISEIKDPGIVSIGRIVENNENVEIETRRIQVEVAEEILRICSSQ